MRTPYVLYKGVLFLKEGCYSYFVFDLWYLLEVL